MRTLAAGDESCDMTVMPSKQTMIFAGRGELSQAIERHGGFKRIAERLGLLYKGRRGRSAKGLGLCPCCRDQLLDTATFDGETTIGNDTRRVSHPVATNPGKSEVR
jgi:hypothetical protein